MSHKADQRPQFAVGQAVVVRKLDWTTRTTASLWSGEVALLDARLLVLRAPFFIPPGRDAIDVDGVRLTTGDISTEFYYRRRWYNVFHFATQEGETKGWYCNVAMPARIEQEGVSYVDLYLDLFAHPDGRFTILDEDEFAGAIPASADEAFHARRALDQLITLARHRALPAPSAGK